jgi:hypothetical protein
LVCAESCGGVHVGGLLLPSANLLAIHGDRGVAQLRSGCVIAVAIEGTVSIETPRAEREVLLDLRILPVQYLGGGARGRLFGNTIKDLSETIVPD